MYKRYDSICESLMRGNEIQFVYNSEQFFNAILGQQYYMWFLHWEMLWR